MDQLTAFLDSEAGLALKGLLIVAFLDFATGSFAALRDGSFQLDALAAFVRKHIWGRVAPIGLLLTVGYFGGAAGQIFLAGAIAAATAYGVETAASIWGNLRPPAEEKLTPQEVADGVQIIGTNNPVPQD